MISSSAKLALAAAGALLCAKWLWTKLQGRRSGPRSPPGPPGIPLIGNLLDVPVVDSHIAYYNLAKKYGPVLYLKVLNRPIVVISDVKIATDLLEKRGAIYSDRPPFHMADAAGYEWDFGNMPHDEPWRQRRRLVHQTFNTNSSAQLRGTIRRTTVELAGNILRSPDNFRHHIRRSAAANIIKVVYGIQIADENDPYVDIVEKAMDVFGQVVVPGSNPVDMLPFLLYIPAWVPVLGYWTKRAQELRKYPTDMVQIPYARTKDDIIKGLARACMVTENLDSMQDDASITEDVIKDACAASYLAGADTTVSVLIAFVLAMVCWPEYQKRAQEELDRILGDRLPEFGDHESLPYVEAIIRETYRVYPVAPFAVPHAVEEDDTYDGMLIRKGTTVIPNVWAIMRDENTYPDAHQFNPDRWMKSGAIDPHSQDPRVAGTFGFGRRICPGRHFAEASVFLSIATMLKCFVFRKHVENGVEISPSGEIHTGIVSCPVPFKCTITPRLPHIQGLLDLAGQTYED